MARFFVRLHNPDETSQTAVVEWSSVVDAPLTHGMRTEGEIREHVGHTYGALALASLPERLERLEAYGHTLVGQPNETPEGIIAGNRAGPRGGRLGMRGLWRKYCAASREPEDPRP